MDANELLTWGITSNKAHLEQDHMLSRYTMYRRRPKDAGPLPEGIRSDTRYSTRHVLRPTREIVEAYLADPTDLAWTKFHRAYPAVVEDRFLVEKARFDELATLATEQDVYLGCNCPTKKSPIVGRCHTYLALDFMQQKYPTLGVSYPIFGTVSAQLPSGVCGTMAPVQPLDTRSSLGNRIAGLTPKQMGNRDTITTEGNLHER